MRYSIHYMRSVSVASCALFVGVGRNLRSQLWGRRRLGEAATNIILIVAWHKTMQNNATWNTQFIELGKTICLLRTHLHPF